MFMRSSRGITELDGAGFMGVERWAALLFYPMVPVVLFVCFVLDVEQQGKRGCSKHLIRYCIVLSLHVVEVKQSAKLGSELSRVAF